MNETTDLLATSAIGRAVDHIRKSVSSLEPAVGIVLGSGLGSLVDRVAVDGTAPFAQIPGFGSSTVEGHAGRLVFGHLAGVPVVIMQGRLHLYEGYAPQEVVFPLRVMIRLGAGRLIVTNAAGGINTSFDAQDLMLISDHINLSGLNPLRGKNDPSLGPRFPDMSQAYDLGMMRLARDGAQSLGIRLKEGVYASVLGPSYETPAEIRMLRAMGADAVGMSTVAEVIAARHMGAQVLGISVISNKAAGLATEPLSHEEVKAAADAVGATFARLVESIVERLGR